MTADPPVPERSRWTVHGERLVYESEWMSMALIDVELASGLRFEHHAVRYPQAAVGTLVVVEDRVLMIWRHRVITDSWGWEIPAGRIEPGETVAEAARREALEETGWEPGPTRRVMTWHPANGTSDLVFHLELATEARHRGEPTDLDEVERVEWVPVGDLRELLRSAQVGDGLSVVGVLAFLTGI